MIISLNIQKNKSRRDYTYNKWQHVNYVEIGLVLSKKYPKIKPKKLVPYLFDLKDGGENTLFE